VKDLLPDLLFVEDDNLFFSFFYFFFCLHLLPPPLFLLSPSLFLFISVSEVIQQNLITRCLLSKELGVKKLCCEWTTSWHGVYVGGMGW
jgi:hypothetical protein